MLKKAVYYIYYRIWDMHSRGEERSFAAYLAVITISILLWLNLFSFIGLLRKIDLIPVFFNKAGSIALMVLIIIGDYFLFKYKKKYEKIIQMFKDESKNDRLKGALLVLLYVLLSVIVFVLVALYKPGKI